MAENLPAPQEPKPDQITGAGVPMIPQKWGLKSFDATYVTSMSGNSEETKRKVEACMNGESLSGKDFINLPLDLVDYLIKPNESINEETGEVTRYPLTWLFCADGKIVRFGSGGVVKSLTVLCQTRRPAPWDPPLRVVPKSRDIGSGRQYISLIAVEK